MKLVLTSRIRSNSNNDRLIYKAVPISPNKKEEDLYVLRDKRPSPIRMYVTLEETTCSVPEPNTPVSTPNQPVNPKPASPTNTTENKGSSQPTNSIAIPTTSEKQQQAALKFLQQAMPNKKGNK